MSLEKVSFNMSNFISKACEFVFTKHPLASLITTIFLIVIAKKYLFDRSAVKDLSLGREISAKLKITAETVVKDVAKMKKKYENINSTRSGPVDLVNFAKMLKERSKLAVYTKNSDFKSLLKQVENELFVGKYSIKSLLMSEARNYLKAGRNTKEICGMSKIFYICQKKLPEIFSDNIFSETLVRLIFARDAIVKRFLEKAEKAVEKSDLEEAKKHYMNISAMGFFNVYGGVTEDGCPECLLKRCGIIKNYIYEETAS